MSFAFITPLALFLGGVVFAFVTHIDDKFFRSYSFADWVQFLISEAIWIAFFGSIYGIPFSLIVLLPAYLLLKKAQRTDGNP